MTSTDAGYQLKNNAQDPPAESFPPSGKSECDTPRGSAVLGNRAGRSDLGKTPELRDDAQRSVRAAFRNAGLGGVAAAGRPPCRRGSPMHHRPFPSRIKTLGWKKQGSTLRFIQPELNGRASAARLASTGVHAVTHEAHIDA